MLPNRGNPSVAYATAVVAALALLGCSDAAPSSVGSTNADLSPSHKHADGGDDADDDDDDDASAADAGADDSATPDAQSDGATTDAPPPQGDAGATDAGDGACPCGVVDPYECDALTQKCAQNPSCSSCQLLSQVCACAPCDDAGHHCH
jgi:hypothetical protein